MTRVIHRDHIPLPTPERPWAQVEWLFDSQTAMVNSHSHKGNFKNAKKHFLAFLEASLPARSAFAPYWVDSEFDEYVLIRFKQYIEDKSFSSGHTATVLSAARQTMRTAIQNDWIKLKSFIDFALPAPTRETDARTPYTEKEMAAIVSALNADIRFARSLLKPYVKSGLGRAPRLVGRSGRYENGWWDDEDNLRWYFENVLECRPITGSDPTIKKEHRSFLARATNQHGGLHEMYRRWGVSAWVGPEIILPYLYKLVQITGLNPTVAMALSLDSYQEQHPLTKRAYIRYWKERGSGEGGLYLELLDPGILALDPDQSRDVRRIWDEVSALTASFRDDLPPESKDRLFVYQSRGVRNTGHGRDFLMDNKSTGGWAGDFVSRHRLTNADGQPLRLTLARFRPSLVSRMLKRGADISQIQAILGHASVLTTYSYIESHDFNPKARAEVHRAVEKVRENRRQQQVSPKPVAADTFEENEVVFATGLALCKNVFTPPDNIRKAARIDSGSPCTLFNMCLRCPNVLIMEEHLPHLFALRAQYLVAMEQGVSSTTHRAAIQQNIHILNHLLNAESSDWPDDVLAQASRESEFIDLGVDPVAMRGVQA